MFFLAKLYLIFILKSIPLVHQRKCLFKASLYFFEYNPIMNTIAEFSKKEVLEKLIKERLTIFERQTTMNVYAPYRV